MRDCRDDQYNAQRQGGPTTMAHQVIHFEIIGRHPEQLRRFYGELFGWDFDTSGPVAPAVSEAGNLRLRRATFCR
jgi:predicted enzyme related to lactoylglutathione lyase